MNRQNVILGSALALCLWSLVGCSDDSESDPEPPAGGSGTTGTGGSPTGGTPDGGVGVTGGGGTGAAGAGGSPVTGGAPATGGTSAGAGTCDLLCTLTADSGCEGSATFDECLPGCQSMLTGSCATSLQSLIDCVTLHPTTACSILDIVYFPDCETEQEAFFVCSG